MTAGRGNPDALALGPGYLFWGPLGTSEPVDLVTPWDVVDDAWIELGYTAQGSEWDMQMSTSSVMVAEELDTIKEAPTGRTASVSFDLAQLTATNLSVVHNGGTVETSAGLVTFEPPDLTDLQRCMLGFQSEDLTERWIFRQCIQNGQVKVQRQKGASNATIACQFTLELPVTGQKLYKALLASPQRN